MENFTTESLHNLLSSSLPILCKNALSISDVYFSIEALVGVSVGDKMIMTSFKEVVDPDGNSTKFQWRSENETPNNMGTSCFKTEPKIELMPQANYNPTIQVKPEFDIYSQQQCQEQTMPNYSVTQVASSKNPKTSAKTRKMNNHALKRRPNFNSQNMIKKKAHQQNSTDPSHESYNSLINEICQQAVDQSMSMETSYVCHICQARRNSKASLVSHIRGTHLSLEKYQCKYCGTKFKWFMQLYRHKKKFHAEEEEANKQNTTSTYEDDGAGRGDAGGEEYEANNQGYYNEETPGCSNEGVYDGGGDQYGGY